MKVRVKGIYILPLMFMFSTTVLLEGCGGSSSQTQVPGESVGSGPGKVTLSWDPPTVNSDGSPLTDLASYRIYFGKTSPLSKSNGNQINPGNHTTYELSGLDVGTYYFAVSALDFSGNESDLSEETDFNVQ